jgi:transcriptional regulator GlxA family with amidase domain
MNFQQRKCMSVGFVLAPSFTLSTFAAFIDVLRLAADQGDRSRPIQCSWAVIAHDEQAIKSSCGIAIAPTAALADPRQYDYIVVVGGLLYGRPVPAAVLDYLRLASELEVPLVGLCTGSFVLARAGLMDGYRSCVSWFHFVDFVSAFPDLAVSADELFIVDRGRLTGAGGTSVVHLAAHLVERHCGKPEAIKALRIMIEGAPLPSITPQPQPLITQGCDDPRVARAVLLIERNLATPLTVEQVARHVHVSDRQLERLFQSHTGLSPSAFAMKLRLRHAHQLLISSAQPIIDIATECGFSSSSHFTNSFRHVYAKTPSKAREQGHDARACLTP